MTIYRRQLIGLTLSEMAGFGSLAFLLYYLPLSGAANQTDTWSVDRVLAYLMLCIGPLLVFLPLSLILRLGPVWLLGAASWTLLGYVLIFTPPPDRQSASMFTYVAFLIILFVALASAFSVPMSALGKRFLPNVSVEWVRALREGSLLALFIVALLAMSPLGVLNWLNVFLVFTIIALTEFFFLARG